MTEQKLMEIFAHELSKMQAKIDELEKKLAEAAPADLAYLLAELKAERKQLGEVEKCAGRHEDSAHNWRTTAERAEAALYLLKLERAEVGECCTRFENSWRANHEEVVRITKLLEDMASARHSVVGLEADGDYYRNLIDNTLTMVWGEERGGRV